MNNSNISNYIFALATMLSVVVVSCRRGTSGDGDLFREYIARLEKTQEEATVAEACRLIDSVAVASPDSLPLMVRTFCRTLAAQQRTTEAAAIASYVWGIDAAENPEIASRLLTFTLLPGTKAPALAGVSPAGMQPNYTLLIFHESTCRTCQVMVEEIREKYRNLREQAVRVISVSTDKGEKAWVEYAATLPWPDKLCDYRGFYSPNMVAWGVASTPTLFLIDGHGKVVDQYGTLDGIWELIFKNGK